MRLHAASHEIVLFLDDDLLCSSQVLVEHVKAHEQGDNLLAFGPVLVTPLPSESVAARIARTHYAENIYGPLKRGEPPAWPVHARVPPNSSIAELLLRFGGFDEQFVNSHEDIELGIRLWRDGVRFLYLPNAEVEHVYVKSAVDLSVGEAVRAGKTEVMLCRKHHVYRTHSLLAGLQNNRLFRCGAGDFLFRSPTAVNVAGGAISMARKFRTRLAGPLPEARLLALESNVNLQRSAVKEAGSWQSFRAEFWTHLPVLMYHHIGEFRQGMYPGLSIAPNRFATHMRWLAEHGYTPICNSDWLAWCERAKPLPAKPVMITFDDAYDDLVEYAFPVLRELRFCAIVFVVTALVGGSNVWDQVQGRPAVKLMSADSIRQWAAGGIEFGAHSRTHPELDHIDESVMQEEVAGSRTDLEEISGMPVVALAYPYGNYNQAVVEAAGRSFRLAFTTEQGVNNLGTNLLRLRRTMVQPTDSMLEFASRVGFGFGMIERTKAALRRFVDAQL